MDRISISTYTAAMIATDIAAKVAEILRFVFCGCKI